MSSVMATSTTAPPALVMGMQIQTTGTNLVSPVEPAQKYECRTCGSNYSRLEYLKRHERKHQDIRPFKCPRCSKEFARSDVLLRHRRRQHPDDPTLPPSLNTSAGGPNTSPPLTSPTSATPTTTSPTSPVRSRGRKRTNTAASAPKVSPPPPPPAPVPVPVPAETLFPVPPPFSPSTHEDWQSYPLPSSHPAAQFQAAFDAVAASVGVTHDAYGFRTSVGVVNGLLGDGWEAFGQAPTTAASAVASAYQGQHSPTTSATSGSSALFHSPSALAAGSGEDLLPGGGSPPTSVSAGGSPAFPQLQAGYEDVVMEEVSEQQQQQQQQQQGVPGGRDVFLPEQTMLKIDGQRMEIIRGVCNRDPSDRFYVPPGFFAYCYQVPRWNLPRLSILCSLASRSLSGMLVHLPFVHEPTFRLANLPGPLAFAICSVGGVASMSGARPKDLDEVASWGQEILPQVRIEKADMLVRNFHKQKKGMTRLEMLAVVQALLLYNAPSLMSSDDCDRLVGHLFLGTIVQIARQAGLFVPTAEHATSTPFATAQWLDPLTQEPLADDAFLERKWREWIQLETYRRAAFLVYILDTLSALESAIPAIVHPNHVAHIPLPAPDTLWGARSAREWAVGMARYGRGVTLDEAMCECLRPVPDSEREAAALSGGEVPNAATMSDDESGSADEGENVKFGELGPFARIVLILTVVRGLITLGEGEKGGGPVTKRWALGGMQCGSGRWWCEADVVDAYQAALQRWKKRWNADRLCPHPALPGQPGQAPATSLFPPASEPSPDSSSPSSTSTSAHSQSQSQSHSAPSASTAASSSSSSHPGPTPPHPSSPQYALVNHASPYYWFAQMLVSIIRSEMERVSVSGEGGPETGPEKEKDGGGGLRGDEARVNRFGGVDLRKMLFVAREYGLCNSP